MRLYVCKAAKALLVTNYLDMQVLSISWAGKAREKVKREKEKDARRKRVLVNWLIGD